MNSDTEETRYTAHLPEAMLAERRWLKPQTQTAAAIIVKGTEQDQARQPQQHAHQDTNLTKKENPHQTQKTSGEKKRGGKKRSKRAKTNPRTHA